jgi:hypothetical protein
LKGLGAYASDETIAASLHLRLTNGFNIMHTDGESIRVSPLPASKLTKQLRDCCNAIFAVPWAS